MPLIDNKNESNRQRTVQTNTNEQTNINTTLNDDKQTNIQDYVSYLRNYTRTAENMKQSFKQTISAAADQVQRNNAIIEGCNTFKKKLNIEQQNYNEQKVELGFENLAEISRQMKTNAKIDLSSSIDSEQGSSSGQSGDSTQGNGSSLSNTAKKESTQTEKFTWSKFKRGLINELKESFWNPSYSFKLVEHGGLLWEGGKTTSEQESVQTNENRQLSQSILENNSELYDKISTAYDKASEIITEVNESVEEEIETAASASSVQENNFIIRGDNTSGCGSIFNDDVNVDQSNELKQIAILNVYMERSNKSDIDATTAAMMADMLGLIQSAQAKQDIVNVQDNKTDLGNKDDQKNKQEIDQSPFTRIIIMIVIGVVACALIGGIFKVISSKQQQQQQPVYYEPPPQTQQLPDYPEQAQ